MLIPVLRDRTSKPPLGVPLRTDGHWSVQGLVGAWAFNEGAGKSATNLVTGWKILTAFGSLFNQDGLYSGGTSALTTESIAIGDNYTIVSSQKEVTAYGVAVGMTRGSSGHRWVSVEGGSTFRFLSRDSSGNTLVDMRPSTGGNTANAWITLAVGMSEATGFLYRDGILLSSAVGQSSTDGNVAWDVSLLGAAGRNMVGTVKYAYIFSRALTPTQIASLSENPWQIYEPEIVWIEVPDGAGGTAYTSSADAGTVTLTGSATTNYHAYVSSADTGSVTLTGSTTSDYRGLVSHADTGTVTITGNAATDYRGLVSHAGAGSVILAGSTSTDYRNLVSSADTSTVTLTGYAAMDTITGAGSYTSNAEAGSITLSGVTTTNYRTLISGAGTGAVTVTGFTATDTVTAAGAYTSEAAAGTILLTGLSVTSHRSSVADSSAIQIVGSDATGYFGFTSGAEPSAVIITGAETSVLRTWISDAIPGSIVIHGYETSGISPIYEISKIFATARLSGPSATGRITTPTTGIRLT